MKKFYQWIKVKKELHECITLRTVRRGEVWWCGVGENVGVEINGKGERFARPVLILKKLTNLGFVGVPLTSQPHEGVWYVQFELSNREQYAVFAQIRVFSSKRLYRKMGVVGEADMRKIMERLKNFLFE